MASNNGGPTTNRGTKVCLQSWDDFLRMVSYLTLGEKLHKNTVINIVTREYTLLRLIKLSVFMEISSQEKHTKRRWLICMYRDLAPDKHPYDNIRSTQHISKIWQDLWIVLATSPGNEVWLMHCHRRKGQICIALTFVLVGSQKWDSLTQNECYNKNPCLLYRSEKPSEGSKKI